MKRYLWGSLALLLILVLGAAGYYLYRHATPYQELVDHGRRPKPAPIPTWPPRCLCANAASRSITPTAWKYWPP